MQRGEPPPAAAIGTAYSIFTQLPAESKAMMAAQLPPQAQTVATALISAPALRKHTSNPLRCS